MKPINLVCGDYKKLFDRNKKNIIVADWLFNENLSKGTTPNINYHWQNHTKLNNDTKYIFKTYKKYLKKISLFLNKYHNLNEKEEYWEILIFNWLWQIIFFTYDRWEIIRNIKKKYKNLQTKIIKINDSEYIPFDNTDVIKLISSKSWNHLIFSKIIRHQKIKISKHFPLSKFKIIDLKIKNKKEFGLYPKSRAKIFTKGLYLPRKFKTLLNLSYGQFNILYNSPAPQKNKTNIFIRSQNLSNSKKKDEDKFHDFLNDYLPKCIPSVHLESFVDIKIKYKKINWPDKPKIILTSILHLSDPIFRYYVANKKKIGAKLVVMQHGGKYGYSRFRLSEYYENRVCDRFLTWGDYFKKSNYFNKNKKYKSLFTPTIVGEKKIIKNNNQNKVLMTTGEFPFTLGRSDGVVRGKKQVLGYKNFILKFIKNLNTKIVNQLEIKNVYTFNSAKKISRNDKDYLRGFSNIEKSIRSIFPKVKIFYDKKYAFKIRERYILQIETMDGTGFLEALSLNNPVILIYNPQFFPHDKNSNQLFLKLKKVKILFDSERKAADFLNKNLNFIEKWWNDQTLQKVRKEFCEEYAKFPNEPLKKLRKSLKF
jgi:putative transferase (TIGR04331 family)